MQRLKRLINKSFETLRNDGLFILLWKTANYFRKNLVLHRDVKNKLKANSLIDVLYINGCYLPHPVRYRVAHQREQLIANGISSNEIFFEDLTLDIVKFYRCYVFFRCPSTDTVKAFIKQAKSLNKTVLFDIDDLVIDTKYTEQIKYLKTMSQVDKQGYDDGVARMQEVLRMCDYAITTTERLAEELRNYVSDVFINRNTASEKMVELSNHAYRLKKSKGQETKFRSIGYFSGSITHNDDFLMILPAIKRLLDKYKHIYLHLAGEIDLPETMISYKNQIIIHSFVHWTALPQLLASVDINIAPLEDTIFNEAKSEIKWIESALVGVPTVASHVGAFRKMIEHGNTGFLCTTVDEWFEQLEKLVLDDGLRTRIGENARNFCLKNCSTIYTGFPLAKFIRDKMKENIAFVLPSMQISGGSRVVLKHCVLLKKAGYDVFVINDGFESENIMFDGTLIPVVSRKISDVHMSFDKCIATLWSTVTFISQYPNIKKRYYLVQNFETDFYQYGEPFRIFANQTYTCCTQLNYITISKWCQSWLSEKYEKPSRYARNGLALGEFTSRRRQLGPKIRILVEGNSDDHYKNVDESFEIVSKLSPEEYEVWFMSYQGEPKRWYRVDKFLHKVPYQEVGKVYMECDILLKTSILESFSYPPLEMMATGGYVVILPNEGNVEYIIDGYNCLFYERGNHDSAVMAINRLKDDLELQDRLYRGGLQTAQDRSWDNLDKEILDLYLTQ